MKKLKDSTLKKYLIIMCWLFSLVVVYLVYKFNIHLETGLLGDGSVSDFIKIPHKGINSFLLGVALMSTGVSTYHFIKTTKEGNKITNKDKGI